MTRHCIIRTGNRLPVVGNWLPRSRFQFQKALFFPKLIKMTNQHYQVKNQHF